MHRHFYFQETLSKGREIWYTNTVQGVLFDAEFLEVLWCSNAACTYITRARWDSSDFEIGTLFRDMEIGTPITFLECNAMVNDTICGGA